ncbi:hypothetical protein C2S51_026354 [Perilla frutescens var. frutescens]|nr:hypothetical protein C2S51_026354 [Perilla frutescens var. frutescens]
MVTSYYLFLFTFISLTFLCNNNINPTAAESPDLINNICSKALNASHCLEFLRPLYHPGDSVRTLTQNTMKSSSTFVFLVYDEIHAREKQTIRDPVLNKIFNKCGEEYTAAVNALNQGIELLQSGDYQNLPSIASNALSQTQSCDTNFTPGEPEPSDFKILARKAQNVCSIVLILSKQLVSGKF